VGQGLVCIPWTKAFSFTHHTKTVCGLWLALSVTVNVPVLVPLALGSKKTAMEQEAPFARLFPQELTAAKSLEGAAVTR